MKIIRSRRRNATDRLVADRVGAGRWRLGPESTVRATTASILICLVAAAVLSGCAPVGVRTARQPNAVPRPSTPFEPSGADPAPSRIHLWSTSGSTGGLLVGWCFPASGGVATTVDEVECRLSELSFGHGWADFYEEWLLQLPAVADEELRLFFHDLCASAGEVTLQPGGLLARQHAAAEALFQRACSASDAGERRQAARHWMTLLHEYARHRCDVSSRPIYGRFRRESEGEWVDRTHARATLRAAGPFRWEYYEDGGDANTTGGNAASYSTLGLPFEANCAVLETELPIFYPYVWGRK